MDTAQPVNAEAIIFTKQQAAAWVLIGLIKDTIEEAGGEGVPSGSLYSAVMGTMDLETYQAIIDFLKRSRIVTESNYVLTYFKATGR